MTDANKRAYGVDRERILVELARRESEGAGEPLNDVEEKYVVENGVDESTIQSIQAQLETLVIELRQPPPSDDYAEESGCWRAIELAERIAHRPEFTAQQPAPDHIGPYQVVAKLGDGGMGSVYKAVHTKLKRVVAIKVLPTFRAHDATAVARFEREMLAVGNLHHRNIVAATDAGEAGGMHYLVMEYVDGVDLSTLVRRVGPLAVADACEIVRQAATGLKEAHQRGIVHRDVKPSNLILVEADPRQSDAMVKVLDFGLARLALDHADNELTNAGQIMGTLKYMAPEQCSNSRDVDARADVYSLGATLYRLLSGESPFSSARFDSPLALVAALANEEPARLSSLRSELPERLVAVVGRMMAKQPSERYGSADEVIAELAHWSQGADLAAVLESARCTEAGHGAGAKGVAQAFAVAAKPVASRAAHGQTPLRKLWWGIGILAALAAIGWLASFLSLPVATESPFGAEKDALFARSQHVAEWLSTLNAGFGVLTEQGQYLEVAAGDPLPSSRFELQNFDLNRQQKLQDGDLARLRGLSSLRLIGASYTSIGDDGLLRIGSLPLLTSLFLVDTQVSDRGLAALDGFPQLSTLFLANTRITDTGLKQVGKCQRLNDLSLQGCNISDAGLVYLRGLTYLKSLDLLNTQVTFQGIADLEATLPNCSIQSSVNSRVKTNANASQSMDE